MIGKNVEKLVLLNRIAIIAIILAVLIIGTVPHTSTPNTDSRNKLDSMLASANFNTVDFTPINSLEVPVVGETSEEQNNTDNPADNSTEQDQLLASIAFGTDDVESLHSSLISKRNSRLAQEASNQTSENNASPSTNNYYRTNNSTPRNTNTTNTTTTSSSSSTSSSASRPARRQINYDEVTYVDDNYEAIDSPSDPGNIPGGGSGSSEDPAPSE